MASLVDLLQKLNLTETSAFSLEKEDDYVIDIAAQSKCDNPVLAATSSNHTVRLFSRNNLAGTTTVKGHSAVINGICWGKSDTNLFYTCSADKSVRCWDIRCKPCKEVQKLQGSEESKNVFTCVDINATDRVICAGQEADHDGNAFIFFWDRRSSELLGAYSESHQDDITQVRFHPDKADSLATGSTDGLVCLFDIGEDNEDDALQYTLNSCSTVARVGWCGADLNNVYCTTHIDTVHIWDTVEGDPVAEWTNIKDKLEGDDSIEYILDLLQCSGNLTYVLAGNNNGDVKVVELCSEKSAKNTPKVTCCLPGGHKATVRCQHWDSKTSTLVTGAEDSMLCLWSAGQKPSLGNPKATKVKMKAKKTISKRSNPY